MAGLVIAWVLVRDDFRGKGFVSAIIDLPFALPTIVAGLTLLSPLRAGQPVRHRRGRHADRDHLRPRLRDAPVLRALGAAGAGRDRPRDRGGGCLPGRSAARVLRRIMLPSIAPAMLAGAGLAFARALGEFGSVVLISGNLPVQDRGGVVVDLQPVPERRTLVGGGRSSRGADRRAPWSCSSSFATWSAGSTVQRRAVTTTRNGDAVRARSGRCGSRPRLLALLIVLPVGSVFFRAFQHGFGAAWAP